MGTERLPWLRGKRLLAATAALLYGLLLRLWFVHHAPVLSGDAILYGTIARNLLLHHVYGFNQHTTAGQITYEPTLIRLPGYPLFLALVFRIFGLDNYHAALYLQVAADLLTCILSAALVRRVLDERAALLVLWFAALCPFSANYTAIPLTETLVLLTIAWAFYALYRWMEQQGGFNPWLWHTSAALAFSVLLRPEQGLLVVPVLAAMLWYQLRGGRSPAGSPAPPLYRTAPVLAAALCILLPLVPWTLRNWHAFHLFQPLAPRSATDPGELNSPGFNHWYRTWGLDFTTTDTVYWNINSDRVPPSALPNRAFALGCTAPAGVPRQQLPLYNETVALLADYNRTSLDSPALDARFEHLARERAASEPLCNLILLPLGRLANMLLRPRIEILPIPDEWWDATTPLSKRLFSLFYAGLNLAYLLLGIWGLILWRRLFRVPAPTETDPGPDPTRKFAGTLLLQSTIAAVVLRLLLLLTLDNSEPRYTLELFPILYLWAAPALARRIRTRPTE